MIKGLLFLGGLGATTYGIYRYYTNQISYLKNSDISLLSVKLVSQTKSNITLKFNLEVTNKSEEEFKIVSFNSDVIFNGKLIGEIETPNINKTINPNGGKSFVSFEFSINPNQIGIADILAGLISNRLKSNLSLEGRMRIKKGFVTLDSPVSINYKLNELF